MSIEDAEALVRAHMSVTSTLGTAGRSVQKPARNEAYMLLRGRLFIDETTKEAIALFDAPPQAEGRVVAAWRTLPIPRKAWNDILDTVLVAKYGRPADLRDHDALWAERRVAGTKTGDCKVGSDGRWNWTPQDNGSSFRLSSKAGESPTSPTLSHDSAAVYDGCGPTLRVRNPQLMGDDPTLPLETQLFDLGVLSWLFDQSKAAAEAEAAAAAAATAPKIKF